MMMIVLLSVIIAFMLSIIFTPAVKKIAVRYNVCALPNYRTVHDGIIPKLGGIAIYLAFILSLMAGFYLYFGSLHAMSGHVLGLILGATLVLFLGIFDDIHGANCYHKLTVQAVAALIAIHYGYQISSIYLPFGGTINMGVWSIPVTVLWIAGISNAINLIDGLDGLAAGISLGVVFTFFLISLMFGDFQVIMATATLVGVMAGFLIYNFNPAKIFMGDSGSLLIGFILACYSINGTNGPSSSVKILIPMVAMGIPIMDTTLAIIRRLRRRVHPFRADKEHIHHRLLCLGFSQRKAVALLYSVSAFLGITAFLISVSEARHNLILLSIVAALAIAGETELTLQFRNGKKKVSPGGFR